MDTLDNWNNLLACTHLFIILQSMEPLLNPGLRVKITRSTESKIYFSVHPIGSTKPKYYTTIKAKDVTDSVKYNNCISLIWAELNRRHLTIPSNQPQK